MKSLGVEIWHHQHSKCRSPIPAPALYVLLALFLLGVCVSAFFLIVIHNAIFFLLLLCTSTLIAAFLLWNSRNAALFYFFHSFPDSDLNLATHGQLVKITGVVSCGNVSLESSYEKVSPCVYTSTTLYECRDVCLKPLSVKDLCLRWRLACSERHSADFYITDLKSGIRALVKAGPVLSSDFRKWLRDKQVSAEAHSLCLEEGYIKEGSLASVVGILQKNNDISTVEQPRAK